MSFRPLSLDLTNVDTSMPRLVEGKYPGRITGVEYRESKKTPGSFMLNLTIALESEELKDSTTGNPIKSGFKINRNYCLPPYGDGTNDETFTKSLTLLALAIMNKKNTPENVKALPPFDNAFVADMEGKNVMVAVKTEKAEEGSDYGDRSVAGAITAIDA